MLEAITCDPQHPHPAAAALVDLQRLAGAPVVPGIPAADRTPVATIMTREVVSFRTEDGLEHASQIMLDRAVSGAPVVDARGRPVGMVSKTDLLEAWMAHRRSLASVAPVTPTLHQGGISMPLGSGFHIESPSQVTVGDVMVPYLLAVSASAPIGLAAALMAYEGVHRLLVLDESNKMIGLVAAVDVLRWMAQLSGLCLPDPAKRV